MKPLILAGSYEQAQVYARRLGLAPNGYQYVTPHAVRGRMNPVVYRVGTWRTHPDRAQIEAALLPAKPTYIDIDEA